MREVRVVPIDALHSVVTLDGGREGIRERDVRLIIGDEPALSGLPGAARRAQAEQSRPHGRENAVAHAHDSFVIAERTERQSGARTPVALVGVHQAVRRQSCLRGGFDGQCSRHGGHQVGRNATAGGNHIAVLKIEGRHAVEFFRPRRLVFVAQPVGEGNALAYFELVLDVITLLSASNVSVRARDGKTHIRRIPEQQIRICEAAELIVERQRAGKILRLFLIVHLVTANIESGLQVVAALEPRDVVSRLVSVLGLRDVARRAGPLESVRSSDFEIGHGGKSWIVVGIRDALQSDFAHCIGYVVHAPTVETLAGVAHLDLVHQPGVNCLVIGDYQAGPRIVVTRAAVTVQQGAGVGVLIVDGEANAREEVVFVAELVIETRGDVVGVEHRAGIGVVIGYQTQAALSGEIGVGVDEIL